MRARPTTSATWICGDWASTHPCQVRASTKSARGMIRSRTRTSSSALNSGGTISLSITIRRTGMITAGTLQLSLSGPRRCGCRSLRGSWSTNRAFRNFMKPRTARHMRAERSSGRARLAGIYLPTARDCSRTSSWTTFLAYSRRRWSSTRAHGAPGAPMPRSPSSTASASWPRPRQHALRSPLRTSKICLALLLAIRSSMLMATRHSFITDGSPRAGPRSSPRRQSRGLRRRSCP
mmetsp:Transcript_2923/g.11800  ORF Transcript_2923/g.11800 Transcript_2923/m.11800 type:complete len:235 (-) Transcript_2923:997-1701(-)